MWQNLRGIFASLATNFFPLSSYFLRVLVGRARGNARTFARRRPTFSSCSILSEKNTFSVSLTVFLVSLNNFDVIQNNIQISSQRTKTAGGQQEELSHHGQYRFNRLCEGLRAAYEHYGDYYWYETEVMGEERPTTVQRTVVPVLVEPLEAIKETISKLESVFVPSPIPRQLL